MPVYEIDLTVPKTSTELAPAQEYLWVMGNWITRVEFIFPPGPARLTNTALYYGIRKMFPTDPDHWIKGNNDVFRFEPYEQLPDVLTRLRFMGWNNGGTYDHTVGLRIITQYDWEVSERIRLKELIDKLTLLLRRIGVT